MKPSRWRKADPVLVGLIAAVLCGLQAIVYGLPVPFVHDEFSYLLAADTFARGRCTNPPHPLWQHFESMHILQRPTYASKYPPGQGLFLAAGEVFAGHPIVGVWLGIALACGAGTWMLRAYVPRWWAVAGGLLMASRLGFGEWGWMYWGGGVAVAGGALFVGGWVRVLRRPRPFPAAVMAAGLALLAVSRPFEGAVLCLPVGLATLAWLIGRHRPPLRVAVRQALVPALAVLVPAALALGYYNYRVTGNALRLPYVEHTAQYDIAPPLLVQDPYPEPKYRHKELQDFHREFEYGAYLRGRDYKNGEWYHGVRVKLRLWWFFYLGYGLSLPLFALPWVLLGSPQTRFALAACVVVLGVVATLEVFGPPHYVAPAACLLYLIVIQGFRVIALWRWWGWPVGRWLAGAWLAGCVLLPAVSVVPRVHEPARAWLSSRLPADVVDALQRWLYHQPVPDWVTNRERLAERLRAKGGRHLVLVTYADDHSYHQEWVYNEADIDGGQIVWARPMGPEGAERLARYFADRTVWLLKVGTYEGQLELLRPPVAPTRRTPAAGR